MRVKLSEYIYIYTYGFCIVKIIIIIILVQLCILCIYACSFDWLLHFEQAAFVVCPNVSGIVSWLVLIEVACNITFGNKVLQQLFKNIVSLSNNF